MRQKFGNLMTSIKQKTKTRSFSYTEAKLLAMWSVVSVESEHERLAEMELMTSLCSLDDRVEPWNQETIEQLYQQFQSHPDELFDKIAESIHSRQDRLGLLASACLLASIDGRVSQDEERILNRLGKVLRLTLEEIHQTKEQVLYLVETMLELRILTH